MRYPCPTLLYDICIADAYGMGYEYVKDATIRATNTVKSYRGHPHHPNKPGTYTDDGQMSIAVAETLIEHCRPLDADFIYWFLECFRRDPRTGYSGGFYRLLNEITRDPETGERLKKIDTERLRKFIQTIRPNSTKNGAAMRAVPIGVLENPSLVLRFAKTQASITHDTEAGIVSAQAVALMSHFALYEYGDFKEMGKFCESFLPQFKSFEKPWQGEVSGGDGRYTAHAAYTLLTTSSNRLEVLRRAVELGGDTDTVAAVAFGIASIRMRDPLPESLESGFNEPLYDKTYLFDLGAKLMAKHS